MFRFFIFRTLIWFAGATCIVFGFANLADSPELLGERWRGIMLPYLKTSWVFAGSVMIGTALVTALLTSELISWRQRQRRGGPFFDFSGHGAAKYLRFETKMARTCGSWEEWFHKARREVEGQLRLRQIRISGTRTGHEVQEEIVDTSIWTGRTLNMFSLRDQTDSPQTYEVSINISLDPTRAPIYSRTIFRDLAFNKAEFTSHWPQASVVGKIRNLWVLSLPELDDDQSVICSIHTRYERALAAKSRLLRPLRLCLKKTKRSVMRRAH
jgi:hypothetical protein